MTVVVPGESNQPLSIVEWQTDGQPTGRPWLKEYEVPAGSESISLNALVARPSSSAARGGAAMFGDLFKVPFGAQSFAAFVGEQTGAAEPIFGISTADEARMHHYLTFIADSDRDISRGQAIMLGGGGAIFVGTAAALYFSTPRWKGEPGAGAIVGGLGLGMLALGLHLGLSKPIGQQVLESFEAELRLAPENRAPAVAHIEAQLDQLAHRERVRARVLTSVFVGTSLLLAGAATANIVSGANNGREPGTIVSLYGTAALMGTMALFMARVELPTERLLRLYRTDPELNLHIGVTPTTAGGFGLSLAGQF